MRKFMLWMLLGLCFQAQGAKPQKVYQKLETFSKILSYVEDNYIEDVDLEDLLDDAIKGMLSGLDPHTMYMPPSKNKEFKEDTSGEYGGVGMQVTIKDGFLTVISAIEGTPAFEKGVLSNDRILEIDGINTSGMTVLEAVEKIRGPYGTKVKFKMQRKDEKPFDLEIKREKIKVASVSSKIMDEVYGYIKITSFGEKTDTELKQNLATMERDLKRNEKGLKGIILDLRNNPGGLLEQSVSVADVFLPSGLVVSTRSKKGKFQEEKMAQNKGHETMVPMITLINEGTASASEIVAGALQDHRRSIVLGVPSFGKGSVQTVIDLDDGSALKLTVAKYYTPNGKSIQAMGIVPDIHIDASPSLQEQSFREKDLKGHLENEQRHQNNSTIQMTHKQDDVQLSRALEYLKTWDVFKTTVYENNNNKLDHNETLKNNKPGA